MTLKQLWTLSLVVNVYRLLSKDKNRPPLDPAKQERYKIRTTVERANSHLKDNLIPKTLYVKGYTKIAFVLFSAVLCLAALKHLPFLC